MILTPFEKEKKINKTEHFSTTAFLIQYTLCIRYCLQLYVLKKLLLSLFEWYSCWLSVRTGEFLLLSILSVLIRFLLSAES